MDAERLDTRALSPNNAQTHLIRAKSTQNIPSCPSDKCLEGIELELVVASSAAASTSSSTLVGLTMDVVGVSGKLRLRLAATVSGLQ